MYGGILANGLINYIEWDRFVGGIIVTWVDFATDHVSIARTLASARYYGIRRSHWWIISILKKHHKKNKKHVTHLVIPYNLKQTKDQSFN